MTRKEFWKMRTIKFFPLLTIFIALFSVQLFCQTQIAVEKNVYSDHRVFPKIDKVLEFEKALANHAQKYHAGDTRWRVYEIQTGPDFGGFFISEGPKTWESENARGDMGMEHKLDWNKNVAIHLTEKQSASYSIYQESLSTVAADEYADKVQINHVYPKIGHTDDVANMFAKIKKAWVATGETVAVFAISSSGHVQFTLVILHKQGLKERNPGFFKPFIDLYEIANGVGSYAQYHKDAAEFVDERWDELLFLRKDLSSK